MPIEKDITTTRRSRAHVEGREEVGPDGVGRDGGDRGRHDGVWLDGGVLGRGGRDDEQGGGGGKLSLWRKAQARVSAAVCRGRANARQAIEGRHRAGKRARARIYPQTPAARSCWSSWLRVELAALARAQLEEKIDGAMPVGGCIGGGMSLR